MHNPIPRKAYSVSKKLKGENKINDNFEVQLAGLSLEEIIALKLELATRETKGKYFGFQLWQKIPFIIKDALLKAAVSGSTTRKEAARFLGLSYPAMKANLRNYNVFHYFEKKDLTD